MLELSEPLSLLLVVLQDTSAVCMRLHWEIMHWEIQFLLLLKPLKVNRICLLC